MKVSVKVVVAMAMLLSVTMSASADLMVSDHMYFGDWNGGKFTAYPEQGSTFTPFVTFCAEVEGQIQVNGGPGYAYQATGIGTANDAASPKTLTEHAAWLYTAYRDGELTNDYAVQYGIWKSLGYTDAELAAHGCNTSGRNFYNNPANGMLQTPQTWSGLGDVYIVHVKDLNGNPAQDILVLDTQTHVPEPATMSLLALGGLAMLRRKLR